MKLYQWAAAGNAIIFSLANDIQEARRLAIQKAAALDRDAVYAIVNNNAPLILDAPTSFIIHTRGQLI